MEKLTWESRTSRGKCFEEADLTDLIDDAVIDSVEGIDVTIRRYSTVYTIAAIIDLDGNPGYMPDDSDFFVPLGADSFVKLASYRHDELASNYQFTEAIKDTNRKLKNWIATYSQTF